MKKTVFILSVLCLIFFNCSKDDSNESIADNSENTLAQLSNISGNEGSRIEVTINGNKTTYSGENVLGWDTDQLLNLNYSKVLRLLHNDYPTLYLRLSLPQDSDFITEAVKTHSLINTPLLLQNSQDLDAIYPEMYAIIDAERSNYSGTVEILRNVEYLETTYDMVGFFNINNDEAIINGVFWKLQVSNW